MKKYIVYIGWFDDLNFKYVFPDKRIFDTKEEADNYAEKRLKEGYNVRREEVEE